MKTELSFVYEHERNRPNTVWLTQPMGGGTVRDFTWKEAMDEARRMAAHLVSLGLPKATKMALFSKNSAWWFLTDLAIWMAGHVSVPLYPTLAPETIRQILEHSEAKLIFIGKLDGYDEMAPGISADLPRIAMPLSPKLDCPQWNDIIAKTEPLAGEPLRDPDELATIVYTSGSTGIPKGVMHSFRTTCAGLPYLEVEHVSPDDRILSYLPLAHVFERAVVEVPAMKVGLHVYFAESLDTFVQDLRRARPTIFMSVPRLWSKFQQGVFSKTDPKKLDRMLRIPILRGIARKKVLQGLGLADVRLAVSGSAPLAAELLAWYRKLGLELLEGYAMTENFSVSHITRRGEVRLGYVGRPQDTVTQKLSDSGEVLVKSPGNMLGYYKAPELTREVLDDEGFVHTGDRGEIDEKGRLKITGRVKELFKTSKGKYVAPVPVENALMVHVDVEQVLVAGASMPQPFGMVILSDAARERTKDATMKATIERSLEEHLANTNTKLDAHEQLEKLVIMSESWTVNNGMLTPTLKIRRQAIEKRYEGQFEEWYAKKPRVLWV